ncbi:MAG: hypothetical protein ACRED9_03995 [Caulobacteraceae bacterium]
MSWSWSGRYGHPGRTGLAAAWLIIAVMSVIAGHARAQDAYDNAATSASDAFGSSVGGQSVGLYSPNQVRGFSPISAGNVRIDGLYFDEQGNNLGGLLTKGNIIHVGLSAQSYPLPAPTGIVDFQLRMPTDKLIVTPTIQEGAGGNSGDEYFVVASSPVADHLGIVGALDSEHDRYAYGGGENVAAASLLAHWQARPNLDFTTFLAPIWVWGETSQPEIMPKGNFLPAYPNLGHYWGEPWALINAKVQNYGFITSWRPIAALRLEAGIFRSDLSVGDSFQEELANVDPSGVGDHLIFFSPPSEYDSTSGELRGIWQAHEGPRTYGLELSSRGREIERSYSSGDEVDAGPETIGQLALIPRPDFAPGNYSRDHITQFDLGASFAMKWLNLGQFSVGVQKAEYNKTTTGPDIGHLSGTLAPILFNATAAADLTRKLTLWGGYTQGLEEEGTAPSNAVNQGSSAPGFTDSQKEAGLRYQLAPKVSMVADVFEIAKPYYNLDSASVFRQLGTDTHRGVEFSVAGQVLPGLTVVLGGTALEARVQAQVQAQGAQGANSANSTYQEVGIPDHTVTLDVDWRIPYHKAFALVANVSQYGRTEVDVPNTLSIPAWTDITIGGRYMFKIAGKPASFHVNVGNVFDAFGWSVVSPGILTPNPGRSFSAYLVADF